MTSSLMAGLDVKLTVFTRSLKSCVAKPLFPRAGGSADWKPSLTIVLSGLGQGFSLHLAALPAPWVLSGPRSCREKTYHSVVAACFDGWTEQGGGNDALELLSLIVYAIIRCPSLVL